MSSVARTAVRQIHLAVSAQEMGEWTYALGKEGEEDFVWLRLNGVRPYDPQVSIPGVGIIHHSIALFGGATKLHLSLPWSHLRDGMPIEVRDRALGYLQLELRRPTKE